MTQNNVTYEAPGNANGTTVSQTNSGLTPISGSAALTVAGNTGGSTLQLDSTAATHGSFGANATTAAGAANGCFQILTPISTTDLTFTHSFTFTLPATPGATVQLERLRSATGDILRLEVTSGGTLQITDAGGTAKPLATSGQLTVGTKYRLQVYGTVGASITTGAYTAVLYLQSNGTQVGSTASSTTANMGTTAFNNLRTGVCSTTVSYTFKWDDVQLNTGTQTPIGDYVPPSNVPPVVSAGSDQTATAGSTVTLTGSASDSDGTIASVSWTTLSTAGGATTPTLTGANTNTATFTAAVGRYQMQFAATDNSGATSTSQSTVYVPAATAAPIASTENSGAWTGSYTDLADVSDSTYVQSSGSGTNTYRLAPVTQNSSLVITVRAAQTGTGATLTVTLLQGTTSIATWTLSGLTTTPTDYPLALTSTQVAAITNWNALDVRFS